MCNNGVMTQGTNSADGPKRKGGFFGGLFRQKEDSELKDNLVVFEDFIKKLKERGIELTKEMKILEIGSGKGKLLRELLKRGYNMRGIDPNPRHEGDLPIKKGNIEDADFADETFDVVISIGVFDRSRYVQDQGRMLEKMSKILKPGGVCLVDKEAERFMPVGRLDFIDTHENSKIYNGFVLQKHLT